MPSSARVATITAANENPLVTKHQPAPMVPMSSPAAAGPMMRVEVMTAVLSPMALEISPGSTSCEMNARRAGLSTALISPSRRAQA